MNEVKLGKTVREKNRIQEMYSDIQRQTMRNTAENNSYREQPMERGYLFLIFKIMF